MKLIMSINNMQLFLDYTQSILNFEPSIAGIHEVLREIKLCEHKISSYKF